MGVTTPALNEAQILGLRQATDELPGRLATAPVYPTLRTRVEPVSDFPYERYERYETTEGLVTVGDADAQIIAFSGTPDSIVLRATTFDALVTLTNRAGQESHEILVVAGDRVETHLSRDRVLARNRVAGSAALLYVEGKWRPGPRQD